MGGLEIFVSGRATVHDSLSSLEPWWAGCSLHSSPEGIAGKVFPCWFYLFSYGQKCRVAGVGQSLGASVADGGMEGLWDQNCAGIWSHVGLVSCFFLKKHEFLTVKKIFILVQVICLKVLGWGRALSLCT